MEMIATIAAARQKVLGPIAQEAGRASGLIRRVRTFDGAGFGQRLVLGYQGQPEATLEDWVKRGATVGGHLRPQGLAQRFGAEVAGCMQRVLAQAVGQLIAMTPAALPLLARFNGLYLQDATRIALPQALAAY